MKGSLLRNLFRKNISQKQGCLIPDPSLHQCPSEHPSPRPVHATLSSQQESSHQSHCFHLSSHQLLPGPQRLLLCRFHLWLFFHVLCPPHGCQRQFSKQARILHSILSWFSIAFRAKTVPTSWLSTQSPDSSPLPHLSGTFSTDPQSSPCFHTTDSLPC